MDMSAKTVRVGYWWRDEKMKSKNLELNELFKDANMEFVKIDLEHSLEEQGPFEAIVHKIAPLIIKANQGDKEAAKFCEEFKQYTVNHPETIIIDPLENVIKLMDRYQQYKLIEESQLYDCGTIFAPSFVEFLSTDVEKNSAIMKQAGITFPIVCKPSLAHGSMAHKMCLIFNEEGLKNVQPPCVAQTFVNHNAVLYKIFVVGKHYQVIKRPSLKNFYPGNNQETIFFNSHDISKPHSASSLIKLDEDEEVESFHKEPEADRLDVIVETISNHLKLALYGIDIIIDNHTGHYAIIDTNIFPGYNGVENYLILFRDMIAEKIKSSKLPSTSSLKEGTSYCTNQDDSGIDTSDSCDEKKNKKLAPIRTTKKIHSRICITKELNSI